MMPPVTDGIENVKTIKYSNLLNSSGVQYFGFGDSVAKSAGNMRLISCICALVKNFASVISILIIAWLSCWSRKNIPPQIFFSIGVGSLLPKFYVNNLKTLLWCVCKLFGLL